MELSFPLSSLNCVRRLLVGTELVYQCAHLLEHHSNELNNKTQLTVKAKIPHMDLIYSWKENTWCSPPLWVGPEYGFVVEVQLPSSLQNLIMRYSADAALCSNSLSSRCSSDSPSDCGNHFISTTASLWLQSQPCLYQQSPWDRQHVGAGHWSSDLSGGISVTVHVLREWSWEE